MALHAKLPDVGTTIFTVMSQLAQQHGAINLSQGFPDYPVDAGLLDAVGAAMRAGHNQYAPMPGLPALREAIAGKILLQRGVTIDADQAITVTAGATQALYTVIATVLHAGDEAIILDPAYDSYAPAILAQGARPVRISLRAPDFALDIDALRAAISSRTRLLIINNPNNPATSLFTADDMQALATVAEEHDLLVLSDEVYEHLVFDGARHLSVLDHPSLRERSFAVYSFGKTFHATGWKIGYCVAPPALMREFRKLHQFLVFCVHSPSQHALAAWLQQPQHWQGLTDFFQTRRDHLAAGLAQAGFHLLPCRGSYFQLADYRDIRGDLNDLDFARWLTIEHGVATIPLSPFYARAPEQTLVRFCFAKQFATLDAAIARLQKI